MTMNSPQSPDPGSAPIPDPVTASRKNSSWRTVVIACGALVAAVAGGIFWYFPRPKGQGKPVDPGTVTVRQAITVPVSNFTDVTQAWGVKFEHHTGAVGNKLLPETMGSGVVVLDFDKDGKPDLFFVNSCPWPDQPSRATPCGLFRNKGDGFENVTATYGLDKPIYGMGACAGDFDNDGWIDLFVTAVGGNRLWKNEGGKRFVEVTDRAGLASRPAWSQLPKKDFAKDPQVIPFPSSTSFLDFDGDGNLDLFLCHYVTWAPGIDASIKSNLTGIDRAYVAPTSFEGAQCQLWRNKGDGTFEDVTKTRGIEVTEREGIGEKAPLRPVAKALGVLVADVDGDGWPDIFVANDKVRNFFFHNLSDGKGGRTFKEIGLDCGVAYAEGTARAGMGIDWGEIRPGKPGLVVANFSNEPLTLLTPAKPGSTRFSESALAVGLSGPSRVPMKFGILFVDYDLDGRLDLFLNNGHLEPDIGKVQASQTFAQSPLLFWNTGGNPRCFEPVPTDKTGADFAKPIVGRGSAFADLDGDGDLDLILCGNGEPARILRNDQKSGNHWLRIALEGNGKTVNRSAIGAMVRVKVGDTILERAIHGARGYLSQPDLELTFGLGQATSVDWVEIQWPGAGNVRQKLEKPAIDQRLIITQS